MPSANVQWPVPLTRLNPWYPGQLGGVPGVSTETGLRTDTNGTIFYVDPNAVGVSDLRDGTDPNEPLATVAAALTHCGAYQNDVIVVASNSQWMHADTSVGRATRVSEEVTVTVPGVKIVGLAPSGSLGVPWGPLTNGGVLITVNAMDVLIEGFCFTDPLAAVGNATAIEAHWDSATAFGDNLTVRNCYFGAGLDCGVMLDFSYYADIHHNYFDGLQAKAIGDLALVAFDPDYASVHDNLFLNCAIAIELKGSDCCDIYNNRIFGDDGGTNNFIDLSGGSNNIVSDNWLGCTLAAGQYNATCSDAASGAWIRNHCIDGETGAAPA